MRNRTITDKSEIKTIIDKCDVCYLSMADDDNKPYVLPFNFGYEDNTIFFHSAPEGKKIDILRKNPHVCVAFSTDHKLFKRNEEVACSYGMCFRSVVAHGTIVFVDDFDEKKKILNIIMRKYTGKDFSYNAPAVKNVAIFKVEITKIEGREMGY